jgi:hypothetical protein
MRDRLLMPTAHAAEWTPMPMQRTAGQHTGGHLIESDLAAATALTDRHARSSLAPIDDAVQRARCGDFGRVPARAGKHAARFSHDVSRTSESESGAVGGAGTDSTQALLGDFGGDATAVPQQTQGSPVNGKVTSLDVITGATGRCCGRAQPWSPWRTAPATGQAAVARISHHIQRRLQALQLRHRLQDNSGGTRIHGHDRQEDAVRRQAHQSD